MAGGPVFPFSSYPDPNGKMWPGPHIGQSNSRVDFGMQVMASLDGDTVWHLRFDSPVVLPSGTGYLVLVALANATTGNAQVNPFWVSLDPGAGDNPDDATYNEETTTQVAWSSGDDDDYIETKIALDADTIVAGEIIAMDMTFETASWTLAQVSTWIAFIIWE